MNSTTGQTTARGRPHSLSPLAALAVLLIQVACGGASREPPTADEGSPEKGIHGTAPAAVRGVPSVVELHPEAGTAEGGVLGQPVMDQLGLQFSPGLLIVRAGQPVTFTNSETLSHNVHVTSVEGGETLLSADTEPSSRMEFVFAEAGGYNVSCDTHPGMTAFIYAATGPHAVFATRDGQFTLDRVPPGRYRASVWSVDPALRAERVVEVGAEPLGIDFTDGG